MTQSSTIITADGTDNKRCTKQHNTIIDQYLSSNVLEKKPITRLKYGVISVRLNGTRMSRSGIVRRVKTRINRERQSRAVKLVRGNSWRGHGDICCRMRVETSHCPPPRVTFRARKQNKLLKAELSTRLPFFRLDI